MSFRTFGRKVRNPPSRPDEQIDGSVKEHPSLPIEGRMRWRRGGFLVTSDPRNAVELLVARKEGDVCPSDAEDLIGPIGPDDFSVNL